MASEAPATATPDGHAAQPGASDDGVAGKTLQQAIREALAQDAYLQFMWTHAARFAALLVSVFIVFKVFMVAHFDANVAITLATVSPVPATLLSIVVSLAPIVVAILAFIGWLIANDFWTAGERRVLIVLPALAFTVVSFAVTPWVLSSYLGALGLYLLVLFTFARRLLKRLPLATQTALLAGEGDPDGPPRPSQTPLAAFVGFAKASSSEGPKVLGRIGRNIVLGLLGALVALLATYDLPWLPAEQVVLADHTEIIGYVLAESSDSITLLRDDDRTVVILSSVDAVRTYCRKSDPIWEDLQASRSLLQFALDYAHVPLPDLPLCHP